MADVKTIRYTGDVYFHSQEYCEVETKDGQDSIFKIKNIGENTLTVIVTGAPEGEEFKDFNGKHEIPPNSPTKNVIKVADFQGKTITIQNMSSLDTICTVAVPGETDIPDETDNIPAGQSIIEELPEVYNAVTSFAAKISGAKECVNRTRNLELIIINATKDTTLKMDNPSKDYYFDSGTAQEYGDLIIPPKAFTVSLVCSRAGGIMTGVTGAYRYKLDNKNLYYYIGFTNPYAGCFKIYSDLASDKSAKWAYENTVDEKPIIKETGKYSLYAKRHPSNNGFYAMYEYYIADK